MSLAEALKMENPYESRIQLKEDIDRVDDVYSRANPPREGFTKADQKHMYRMGKVQELKACIKVPNNAT
jgi:hypothetical protein